MLPTPGSWGRNGQIAYAYAGSPGVLLVSEEGGVTETVTHLAEDEIGHFYPVWLPDTQTILFMGRSSGSVVGEVRRQIVAWSLRTGERSVLTVGVRPRYVSSGHLLFSSRDGLWAAPFDADSLSLTGEARPVVEHLTRSGLGFSSYDVSDDGALAYLAGAGTDLSHLVWVDRGGREERLDLEAGDFSSPRVSPDGTRVAVSMDTGDGNVDLYVYDVDRSVFSRLTFDEGADGPPVWTPDGSTVVFVCGGNSQLGVTAYRHREAYRYRSVTVIRVVASESRAPAPLTFCGGGVVTRGVARAVLFRLFTGLVPALSPEGGTFLQEGVGPDRAPLPPCLAAMCDHVRVGEVLHTPTLWLFTHCLCSPTHHPW